jgi:hypothetical protein
MEAKAKDSEFPDSTQDSGIPEVLNPTTASTSDPVKLFSIYSPDQISVNTDYICVASANTLKVIKNSIEEFKLFTFKSPIKSLEISKVCDNVILHLENVGFSVLEIETDQQQDYPKDWPIQTMRWNNWSGDKFGIYTTEDSLELFSKSLTLLQKIDLKNLSIFEFSGPNSFIFQDSDLKCKIFNFSESSCQTIETGRSEKLQKVFPLDEEKFAFQFNDSILVLSLASGPLFTLGLKQIFEFDLRSEFVYFANPGSLQVLIISKDNFLAQRYQDCLAYFTLMESCSSLFVRKKADKPQVVARHGDDVFFYTFKNEAQAEEPLQEIKEGKVTGKKNEKTPAKSLNPKEIIAPVVAALNRGMDEVVKKVEKTVSPHSLNNVVTKTIQSTLEQKYDSTGQKNMVQSTLAQSLRFEFQSTLIPLIQQQLNENFNKLSVIFQESLKNSSDFNNRSAAKATSLEVHMKNAIENIVNTTNKLEKEYNNQVKKINESEVRLSESFEPKRHEELVLPRTSDSKTENLKREIDQKLKSLDFEGAVSAVLREKNVALLFKVLEVINPKSLCGSRIIREPLLKQLFYELIENVERDGEFRDYYLWIEEIVKNMNLKEEATQLIVKLFNISEKKPRIREIIKIVTAKI